MGLRNRIGLGLRTAAGRAAGTLSAFASQGIVPGIGRLFGQYGLPQDVNAQRIVESRDALTGWTTANLGPIQGNISSHPLRGLTPARIAAMQDTVYTVGYMVDWACLIEDIIKGDSQVRSVHKSGREAVTGAPFSVEPADSSPEARAVADYQQTVFDQLGGWDRAMGRLLLGNAGGYALEEVRYETKAVCFPLGQSTVTVDGWTPADFKFVHNKQTRWSLPSDELELDTGGAFIKPPDWKFLYYEADDDFLVRNRGWMFPAVWLSMIKSGAWSRWGVVLDLWGIPVPYGLADPALWQDAKRRAEMLQALIDFGRGKPAIFTTDFKLESSPASSQPLDSRGMHAALIGAINLELAKLIIGSTLTIEISGTGSYNASDTHADSKEARVIGWEKNLSSCVRTWMRAALRLACCELDEQGNSVGVNPRGLSAVLGLPPERVYALCGRPSWRVRREATPSVRLDMYDKAVNKLGMSIEEDSAYREFGFARARHPGKALRGAPVTLAGDAAATSTAAALDGQSNPTPEPVAKAA